jgi:hypothetical protein
MVYGASWDMGYGIWDMGYGIEYWVWYMVLSMGYGIWS